MQMHDITRPLRNDLAPWPGDTAFAFRLNWQKAAGATVNVGAVTMGVHNGTHADAPFHFQPAGATIDTLALAPFVGPAVVMDLTQRWSANPAAPLDVSDLAPAAADLARAPRLLLKTNAWLDDAHFPARIPVLTPAAIAWLGAQGVLLLGVDVPSVDAIDSQTLPNHHALAAAGIAILESLDLRAVPAGVYELLALPLKIVGGDAAPVRAVLREIG
ncbi:MAG: cyclase family protein [Verrucomicrobia bacterium]|nr:cyclase family protein [Verrucomicrobiota bacterium]